MREEASGIKIEAFLSKFPFLGRYVQKKDVYSIEFNILDLDEDFLDQKPYEPEEKMFFFDKKGEEVLQVGFGPSTGVFFRQILKAFAPSRIEYETVGEAFERSLKKNENAEYIVSLVTSDEDCSVYDVHVMQLREKFSEELVERLVAKRLEEIEALRWLHEEA